MRQIPLYSRDPLVISILSECLAKITSCTILGYTNEPDLPKDTSEDMIIVDTDIFSTIGRMPGVLEQRARAGRRTLVLCSFLDAARIPRHENILKLEKPFGVEDVLNLIQRT